MGLRALTVSRVVVYGVRVRKYRNVRHLAIEKTTYAIVGVGPIVSAAVRAREPRREVRRENEK